MHLTFSTPERNIALNKGQLELLWTFFVLPYPWKWIIIPSIDKRTELYEALSKQELQTTTKFRQVKVSEPLLRSARSLQNCVVCLWQCKQPNNCTSDIRIQVVDSHIHCENHNRISYCVHAKKFFQSLFLQFLPWIQNNITITRSGTFIISCVLH
jgi:hypothetical protein